MSQPVHRTDQSLGVTGVINSIERRDGQADDLEALRRRMAAPLKASYLQPQAELPTRSERLRELVAQSDTGAPKTFHELLAEYRKRHA